jgi:hypothetical protein
MAKNIKVSKLKPFTVLRQESPFRQRDYYFIVYTKNTYIYFSPLHNNIEIRPISDLFGDIIKDGKQIIPKIFEYVWEI